jgi:hypothetical protein
MVLKCSSFCLPSWAHQSLHVHLGFWSCFPSRWPNCFLLPLIRQQDLIKVFPLWGAEQLPSLD